MSRLNLSPGRCAYVVFEREEENVLETGRNDGCRRPRRGCRCGVTVGARCRRCGVRTGLEDLVARDLGGAFVLGDDRVETTSFSAEPKSLP